MGFENEGQMLTAIETVVLSLSFASNPAPPDRGFDTKMMPKRQTKEQEGGILGWD
jgi:hypothetical protein